MLVLSRKVGERIHLPDLDIVVTVVAICGNRVRIGIAAPAEIAIVRDELRNRSTPRVAPESARSAPHGSLATVESGSDI